MKKIKITKSFIKEHIKSILTATVGCIIYAASIALFLDPNNLAPGGVSGIAILISALLPISTGAVILALNIPLIIFGIWKLKGKFMVYTAYSTLLSSLLVDVFSSLSVYISVPVTNNLLLASLAGGALMGIGIGVILLSGGSTGGTDIIIRALRIKYKHIKTGAFYLISDSAIIAVSAVVFRNASGGGIDIALYAVVALVACTIILDKVLYGTDEAKLLVIISDNSQAVANRLMAELETGVTLLEGKGAYTKSDKEVIICAVKKHVFTKVREIVREVDSNAFMIVSSASEIFGEGYKEHYGEDI